MNFFDKSAYFLAKAIRNNYEDAASEEILRFSLVIVINTFAAVIFSLLLSLFTHRFYECMIIIAAYTVLRIFSGGIHLSSSLGCCLLSFSVFTLDSLIKFNYLYYGLILDLISLLILLLYAPSDIENAVKLDKKFHSVLKMVSILLVSCNLLFVKSYLLSLAFFTQSLFVTPLVKKLINTLERRLKL
jgi:accessory gene regulator B